MASAEIVSLRRARLRVHTRLRQLEPVVADYYVKLADIEAQIRAIDPYYLFPHRHRKPNPLFAVNEMPRLVLALMRERGEPVAIREIALHLFAIKGVTPDRKTMKAMRLRLQQLIGDMDKRGMTRKVGEGNATKRTLMNATQSD